MPRPIIETEQLSKSFAGRPAIDGVSFTVEEGEIVGFLGPNGAGKTTTLRILTSYLPPTAGRARIAGYDIFRQSLQARRLLGYMPENVPLYDDMRVREYLRLRGALRGLRGRSLRLHMDEVLETCGLREVRRKLIGALSKGFRQRVGLADALIHKPPLLILDEPTNGLDPIQIRQVRELIRNLGQKHTILISTHILPEVEMTCSRVIIINRGRIQASDTPRNLVERLRTAGTVAAELKGDPNYMRGRLEAIEGVKKVTLLDSEQDWHSFEIKVQAGWDLREQIDHLASVERWPMRELTRRTASLEDVFVEMTLSDD